MYYARVVFETNASAAQMHDDVDSAQRWIDEVRDARPALFRSGQIFEAAPYREVVVATCDVQGWHPSERCG